MKARCVRLLPLVVLLASSALLLFPKPSLAASGLAGDQPAVVTYPVGEGTGISVFARLASGRLAERRWNGTSWGWVGHGVPAGRALVSGLSAVAWTDGGTLRFNLFALLDGGLLAERAYDGSRWRWILHGSPPDAPPGVRLQSTPAMVQWISPQDVLRFNVFMVGSDHRLYERWAFGSSWYWAYHDPPAGPGLVAGETPAVAARTLDSGDIAISILLRRGDGSVIERYYVEGIGWRWRPIGLPPGSRSNRALAIASWPRADGNRELLGMAGGPDQALYLLHGVRKPSGETSWSWQNAGTPPEGELTSAPALAAWRGRALDRWNSFAIGHRGRLVELWRDRSLHWSDPGISPFGPLSNARPGLVAWRSGTRQRLDLFAIGAAGSAGHLIGYSFDGSGWRFVDHGLAP